MSFFDDVPPPPPPPEPPPFEHKPWMGPPPGWAGGWVPWHVVLFRTPDLYATLSEVEAYPTGAALGIGVRSRPGHHDDPFGGFSLHRLTLEEGGPRLGVGFADGRKAVSNRFPGSFEEPAGPALRPVGGSGGGNGEFHMTMWLWPLPPPGPLQIVASWPAEGIDEVRHELDATALVDAAGRAEKLWDYDSNEVARARRRVSRRTTSSIALIRPQPPYEPPDKGAEPQT